MTQTEEMLLFIIAAMLMLCAGGLFAALRASHSRPLSFFGAAGAVVIIAAVLHGLGEPVVLVASVVVTSLIFGCGIRCSWTTRRYLQFTGIATVAVFAIAPICDAVVSTVQEKPSNNVQFTATRSLREFHFRVEEEFDISDVIGGLTRSPGFERHKGETISTGTQFNDAEDAKAEEPKETTEQGDEVPPTLDRPDSASNWTVREVQLVGLLSGPPVVYERRVGVTTAAPDAYNKRALTPFEINALARLQRGESVAVAEHDGTTLMLGAIRAKSSCVACHSVQQGDLLGAFSYQMKRGIAVTRTDRRHSDALVASRGSVRFHFSYHVRD